MEAFLWDQHFATGLETVDKQHHHLVDLINRLGESLVAGSADDLALQGVFQQLADYAHYHFTEEERLMSEAGVDARHVERHQKSHRRFIEQVLSMWAARNSVIDAAGILHDFLAAWLSFHILGEDQSMARQIARIRAGEPPAFAFEQEEAPPDGATAALLRALRNLYHVLSEQNRDLAAANRRLEERVEQRTRELARANQALTDANLRLEAASRTDGLLGIANRMFFDERLDEEWRRAARAQWPLALLMIDVDHFKLYNDTYGHQAGDRCLQDVAEAAAFAVHRPGDLLARYGGEELVVMLPNTDVAGAHRVALNIRARLAAMHLPHAASPVADHVTVSIGVASVTPGRDQRPAVLVAAADQALYAAKEAGRDRIQAAA